MTISLKGWRTYIANGLALAALVAINVLDYLGTIDLKSVLPANQVWIPIALAVVNIGLRTITNTPPGKAS